MTRLVLVPGFAQTAASWAGVVAALPPDVDPVPLDVPVEVDFAATAAALADAGGEGTWIGYSLGGRLALRVAIDRPDLVHALVLVSASPGIADPAERAARAEADAALAAEVERDGVAAFLDRWEDQPLFSGVPPDAPGRAERRTLGVDVVTAGLRQLSTGVMAPLWERLHRLRVPLLVVTGTADEKYDRIGDELRAACTGAPVLRLRLEGGHALPQECPGEVARAVRAFAEAVAVPD